MERAMKTLKSVLLLLLMAVAAQAQEVNKLFVPDITGAESSTITLPLSLSNTSTDIVAMQFELSVPQNVMILNTSSSALTERKDDHTVAASSLGNGRYRVLVYSPSNKPLKANSGEVLGISAVVAGTVDHDAVFPIELSDVVLSNSKGDNVATASSNGTFRIKPSPDFMVSGVSVSSASVMPGEKFDISWTVNNIGSIASTGGWSERISLVASDGTEKNLGTFYSDTQSLGAGGVVSRSVSIELPSLLGIDGGVAVKVTVIPNSDSGEDIAYQKNNSAATSANTLNIGKKLFISLPASAVEEGTASTVRCQLSRSGNWKTSQTFSLSKLSGDNRLGLPETVTIGSGQSSVYFDVTVSDNNILDNDDAFLIQASGNDYEPVEATLTVDDDEYPQLTLAPSKSDVVEGETFQLIVTTERVSSEPIVVSLVSETPKRFSYPATATIPAGEKSVTIDVKAVDNEEVELQAAIAFKASADKHLSGECIIVLDDNDLPAIDLDLSPMSVSESAGPVAIVAKLRRMTNTDKKITIHLSDDSDGDIYYSDKSIVLDKGVDEAQFSLGIVDNAIVDGDRQVSITAAVYVSSCSCSASGTSVGVVTKTIEVIDNDGPSLTVSSSKSTLLEGDDEGIVLTVVRNTDTAEALAVSVSSDNDEKLSYEHNVTIPAGAKSVDVSVKALANSFSGDDKTIVFTAETANFSKGTCWVMLTDQTLPDAQISGISVSKAETEVGESVDVSVTICNMGAAVLPEATKIGVYLSNSSTPIINMYTQQALAPGVQVTLSKTMALPAAVGSYELYAVVNDGQAVKELIYVNNTSEKVALTTTAPFKATISTDKATYGQSEIVNISGRVTGNATANAGVEVYVINDGLRQVIMTKTDGEGNFTATYQPYSAQMGHFIIGACYPDEGLTDEMESFDVYGFKRTDNSAITCDVLLGETYTDKFTLSNPGVLPLSGVKATILSKPENCNITVNVPNSIPGGSNVDVSYSLVGSAVTSANEWEQIKVLVETAEGPSLTTTLYYYCRNPKGQLLANVSSINTTMVKGATRDYPITITNIGKGETGVISLSLPASGWMKSSTPLQMSSLSQGESSTIVLQFAPTDAQQLNVPVTGHIGVNCENGDGIPLPFSITPVSEATGKLVIDVCDEWTYNTKEAPHVAGAEIVVKNVATGAVVTNGKTDENGLFSTELQEGYYALSVTADRHDSYSNNIFVDPGTETKKIVDLSYQAIEISYELEETEIEDEYLIKHIVKYETNVPKPVVVISGPTRVEGEKMGVGEQKLLEFTLTNHGLVRSDNVRFILPEPTDEWSFVALEYTDSFALAPNQSVLIPVVLTHYPNGMPQSGKSSVRAKEPDVMGACMAHMTATYQALCGTKLYDNESAHRMAMKACATSAILNAIAQGSGFNIGGIGGGGGSSPGSPNQSNNNKVNSDENNNPVEINSEQTICNPCYAELMEKQLDRLLDKIPGVNYINDGANMAYEHARNGTPLRDLFLEKLRDYWDDNNPFDDDEPSLPEPLDDFLDDLEGIQDDLDDYEECMEKQRQQGGSQSRQNANRAIANSWIAVYADAVNLYSSQITAWRNILNEILGDSVWYLNSEPSLKSFWQTVSQMDSDKPLVYEELLTYKPESVTAEQLRLLVERLNGTSHTNVPNKDLLLANADRISEVDAVAGENGFNSMTDMFAERRNEFIENSKEESSSVCSSVTLKFEQRMVMTRQAFRGTLRIFNGNEENAMSDVRLNLVVRDLDGNLTTSHEFQISLESLNGFGGESTLDAGWKLDAGATGTATILYIPTKYAASEVPVDYVFAGSLSYVDPYTGLEVTRELSPVTLTVKPAPNLDLTYFMQRDLYGDDPLTTDVVEPCQPAEFALVINNKGYGDAKNVRMVTDQPQIVDNEKGLLVNFELLSSQLNGKDNTLALGGSVATDFGSIPAQSTAYAQWWLQGSLLGHFTDYDVEATHVTSYGNPDLSLLDNVTIHELVHGFTVDENADPTVRGFLVNDITDAEDMPDMVYFTNGKQEEDVNTASVSMTRNSDTEYAVTIIPSATGWSYGSVSDITAGRQKLAAVVRQSDGVELPVDNFWLTDRTLRDGKDPLYEYRLHAVAKLSGEETFILTFEPKPEVELEVESLTGVPEDGTILTSPLTSVDVVFNKGIDANSFTSEDITLSCQGVNVDLSNTAITKVSDREFSIGLDGITVDNGYYVLTVQTSGIKDAEGFNGTTGKNASWTQFADGKVKLTVKTSPAEGGDVSPATGLVDYGSVVTLNATPAEGYDFSGWKHGDEIISDNASFDYLITSDDELTAVFALKHFNVDIEYDAARGVVENAASGIYDYGTVLELKAVPNDGYVFDCWTANGNTLSTDASYSITVKDDIAITAAFSENVVSEIGGVKSLDGMVVYPLPLRDVMYVRGDFDIIERLTVTDINGTMRIIRNELENGSAVDVVQLPQGMYIVRAVTDNGTYVRKVLKK